MKNKRLGYILMILGILIPFYFFTSLSLKQIFIKDDVKEKLVQKSEISKELEREINNYKQENLDNNIRDPFTEEGKEIAGSVVGYIFIPKIACFEPLRLGASNINLEYGVAHITGTAMPGSQKGRSIIAGHRSRANNLMFFRINELQNGDKIYLSYKDEIYEYEVNNIKVVKENEFSELSILYPNENVLSLLTCEPIYPPFNKRLLVDAVFSKNIYDVNEVIANSKITYSKWNIVIVLSLLVSLIFLIKKYLELDKKY